MASSYSDDRLSRFTFVPENVGGTFYFGRRIQGGPKAQYYIENVDAKRCFFAHINGFNNNKEINRAVRSPEEGKDIQQQVFDRLVEEERSSNWDITDELFAKAMYACCGYHHNIVDGKQITLTGTCVMRGILDYLTRVVGKLQKRAGIANVSNKDAKQLLARAKTLELKLNAGDLLKYNDVHGILVSQQDGEGRIEKYIFEQEDDVERQKAREPPSNLGRHPLDLTPKTSQRRWLIVPEDQKIQLIWDQVDRFGRGDSGSDSTQPLPTAKSQQTPSSEVWTTDPVRPSTEQPFELNVSKYTFRDRKTKGKQRQPDPMQVDPVELHRSQRQGDMFAKYHAESGSSSREYPEQQRQSSGSQRRGLSGRQSSGSSVQSSGDSSDDLVMGGTR